VALSGNADLAIHPTFVRQFTAAPVKAAVAITQVSTDGDIEGTIASL
jgi:hypothetical protein